MFGARIRGDRRFVRIADTPYAQVLLQYAGGRAADATLEAVREALGVVTGTLVVLSRAPAGDCAYERAYVAADAAAAAQPLSDGALMYALRDGRLDRLPGVVMEDLEEVVIGIDSDEKGDPAAFDVEVFAGRGLPRPARRAVKDFGAVFEPGGRHGDEAKDAAAKMFGPVRTVPSNAGSQL